MSEEIIKELDFVDQFLKKLTLKKSILILLVILLLIAYNRGIALIYALVALIVATYIVAYFVPIYALRSVKVKREMKHAVTQGESLKVVYRLSHTHFFPRYMVMLQDILPFVGYAKNDFLIPVLKNNTSIEYQFICKIRGEHSLGPIVLESGFPLGINTSKMILKDTCDTVLVYPRYFPLKKMPLHATLKYLHQGDYPVEKTSGVDEFIGVREYRFGDPVKHIHWASSAKAGELIVKEFNDVSESSITIVLDLHRDKNFGKGEHTTLEYAVKITASLAVYALEHNITLHIYAQGKKRVALQNLKGKEHMKRVLEVLARVKSDGEQSYEHVIHRLSHVSGNATLVLFQNNETLDKIVTELEQKGYNIILCNFKTYSFKHVPTPSSVKHYRYHNRNYYEIVCGANIEEMFS